MISLLVFFCNLLKGVLTRDVLDLHAFRWIPFSWCYRGFKTAVWRLPEDRPFLIGSVIQHNGAEYSSLSPIEAYTLDPKAKGRGSWKVNPD